MPLQCPQCGSDRPEVFPGFCEAAGFAFAECLEANCSAIRREFLGLDEKVLPIHRKLGHEAYVSALRSNNGWVPSWQVDSDEPNYEWLTYGLCYRGIFPDEAPVKYPLTAGLLRQLGAAVIASAFSLMRRQSFIAPHQHRQLGGDLLTYHLGLQVEPGLSFLNVGGRFVEEQEGKSVIFDGSRTHFAVNMSSADRVILYMEFDRSKL